MTPSEACDEIAVLRATPAWALIDYPGGLMRDVWTDSRRPGFGYRSVFDARLARTLRHHGVTQFATRNVTDFRHFGFDRVFDPLKS